MVKNEKSSLNYLTKMNKTLTYFARVLNCPFPILESLFVNLLKPMHLDILIESKNTWAVEIIIEKFKPGINFTHYLKTSMRFNNIEAFELLEKHSSLSERAIINFATNCNIKIFTHIFNKYEDFRKSKNYCETILLAVSNNSLIVVDFLINYIQKTGLIEDTEWYDFISASRSAETFNYFTSKVDINKVLRGFRLSDYMCRAIEDEQHFETVVNYFAGHQYIDSSIQAAIENAIYRNKLSIEIARKCDKNYSKNLGHYLNYAFQHNSKFTKNFIYDIFENKDTDDGIETLISGFGISFAKYLQYSKYTTNFYEASYSKETTNYIIVCISKILMLEQSGNLGQSGNLSEFEMFEEFKKSKESKTIYVKHIENVLNFVKNDEKKYFDFIKCLNQLITIR